MRELKFRVWDKSIPANTSKQELDNPTGMMIPWSYVKESSYLLSAIDGKYPIMQYTGLKDKNGVEIYEDDIIEATERRYFLGHDKGLQTIRFKSQVVYEDAGFVYSTTQENDSPLFVTDNIQVIGNIYEHPELLKL